MGKRNRKRRRDGAAATKSETVVVEPGGAVIGSIEDLMEAEDCETREELVELLDWEVEGNAWIDWDDSDDTQLAIVVGQNGMVLDYPFTMGEFWIALIYLDALADDDELDDDTENDGQDRHSARRRSRRRCI